jgi:UDP-N-acetylmuramoyl-L-alanyl-D-glutamate--2,6-diaminopimelate ligase
MTTKLVISNTLSSITTDSRQVQPGSLFLAYPGEKSDGRRYIEEAIRQGAGAILWEPQDFSWNPAWKIENTSIKNLRQQASRIAGQFYKNPSDAMWTIGVTGTNGKTSISHWLAQCFNYLERKAAVIGTLGNGLPNHLTPTQNTTPDAVLLQKLLAEYVREEVSVVSMEVSSHGLDQGRVAGVHFDVAVLSNLSRDHLDYHGTIEAYADAKRKLFMLSDLKYAILNADDAFGAELAQTLREHKSNVLTYGIHQGEVRASNIQFSHRGVSFYAVTPYGQAHVSASLLGRFNVYNVLAVLATLLVSKVSLADAVAAIAQIQSANGRMQKLGGDGAPLVVVDYAHTPDALEKVLQALREQSNGRLICVFGCGGNRDRGKRELMGRIASDLADAVVVTSDNPRDEKPEDIVQEILVGMHGKFAVEPDRAKAINIAISSAKLEDIVLIAGKGHEDYQEIAGARHYFSDVEQAQKVLKRQQGVFA